MEPHETGLSEGKTGLSDQQLYLVHVKSETLSMLCCPPAFSWVKVVGRLCKHPLLYFLPIPASAPGAQRYLQPLRWRRSPANPVCLPRRRRRERRALHGRSRPDGVSLGPPCSCRSPRRQHRTEGGEAARKEGPPRPRLDPAAWPQCREPASPILSGRSRFAITGAYTAHRGWRLMAEVRLLLGEGRSWADAGRVPGPASPAPAAPDQPARNTLSGSPGLSRPTEHQASGKKGMARTGSVWGTSPFPPAPPCPLATQAPPSPAKSGEPGDSDPPSSFNQEGHPRGAAGLQNNL